MSTCHEAYSDSVSIRSVMCELDGRVLTTSADGVADSVHVPK